MDAPPPPPPPPPSPCNYIIVPRRTTGRLDLFYMDEGLGLLPVPEHVRVGVGLEQLFDALADRLATRAAVDSMPTVVVGACHEDPHCAVCMEPFELGGEAKEMPCRHMYHRDCILPWLAVYSSCPVCRHQIPTEDGVEMVPVGGFNINLGNRGGGAPASSSSTGGSSSVRRGLFRNMFACFGYRS